MARSFRSAMSSAISGCRPSTAATDLTTSGPGSIRSTQTRAVGIGDQRGRGPSRSSVSLVPAGDQQTIRTEARRLSAQRAIVGLRSLRPSGSSGTPVAEAPRSASSRSAASIRVRAAPPRASPGGIATTVTTPATTNSPTRISDAWPAAHASSASTTKASRSGRSRSSAGMTCFQPSGDREQLVVQVVDRRRAVGGQDGHADRHADHPGDRHDRAGHPERGPAGRLDGRGRARRHGQPEARARTPRGRARPRRARPPASSGPSRSTPRPTCDQADEVTIRSDR